MRAPIAETRESLFFSSVDPVVGSSRYRRFLVDTDSNQPVSVYIRNNRVRLAERFVESWVVRLVCSDFLWHEGWTVHVREVTEIGHFPLSASL